MQNKATIKPQAIYMGEKGSNKMKRVSRHSSVHLNLRALNELANQAGTKLVAAAAQAYFPAQRDEHWQNE